MSRVLALGALGLALAITGCPGTARDFSQPGAAGADNNPPDGSTPVDAGGDATQEAPPPLAVTLVNWNTHDFFNDKVDSPEIQGETVVSSGAYQQKLSDVSGVLSTLAPDIAVMPEVENDNVTADLAAKLGGYPYHTTSQGNDPRGIDIAVISRYPFDKIVSHKNDFFSPSTNGLSSYKYSRDCLEIHLTINGRHVILLGVHFKATSDPGSDEKRQAEAEHTRKIAFDLQAADPTAAIVALGDFNCTPDSAPMQALAGAPPNQLVELGDLVAQADRYSFVYQGQKQLIDNQVLNAVADGLLDASTAEILHSSATNQASDHDPMRAVYEIN